MIGGDRGDLQGVVGGEGVDHGEGDLGGALGLALGEQESAPGSDNLLAVVALGTFEDSGGPRRGHPGEEHRAEEGVGLAELLHQGEGGGGCWASRRAGRCQAIA